jgi:hypothetical protein
MIDVDMEANQKQANAIPIKDSATVFNLKNFALRLKRIEDTSTEDAASEIDTRHNSEK